MPLRHFGILKVYIYYFNVCPFCVRNSSLKATYSFALVLTISLQQGVQKVIFLSCLLHFYCFFFFSVPTK